MVVSIDFHYFLWYSINERITQLKFSASSSAHALFAQFAGANYPLYGWPRLFPTKLRFAGTPPPNGSVFILPHCAVKMVCYNGLHNFFINSHLRRHTTVRRWIAPQSITAPSIDGLTFTFRYNLAVPSPLLQAKRPLHRANGRHISPASRG